MKKTVFIRLTLVVCCFFVIIFMAEHVNGKSFFAYKTDLSASHARKSRCAASPRIVVVPDTEKIDGTAYKGVSSLISLDVKEVRKAWHKHLREYGRVSTVKDVYTVELAEIPVISNMPIDVYSKVVESNVGAKVFFGLTHSDGKAVEEGSKEFERASEMLYDFVVAQYRDDMNMQIEEAEKVVKITVRDYEKKVNEGEKLERNLEKNKEEKKELEQKLKDNAQEKKDLEAALATNKREREAALEDIEKVRKLAEEKKASSPKSNKPTPASLPCVGRIIH